MSKFNWTPAMRNRLRKVGRDRMSTEAWDICEDLLTRIDELEGQESKPVPNLITRPVVGSDHTSGAESGKP